jgi:hypothetical protein
MTLNPIQAVLLKHMGQKSRLLSSPDLGSAQRVAEQRSEDAKGLQPQPPYFIYSGGHFASSWLMKSGWISWAAARYSRRVIARP